MFELLGQATPDVISIDLPLCREKKVKLCLIQTSHLHPLASGNKLFKLAANVDEVLQSSLYSQILSFGGAYSNHLYALAQVGKAYNINCIAVVRGYPHYIDNPTLSVIDQLGVEIVWADKKTYRRRYDEDYLTELQQKYPQAFIIPEGGTNTNAVKGCQQLGTQLNQQLQGVDSVVLACGTGGTLAGLATSLKKGLSLLAYDVVNDPMTRSRVAGFIDEYGKSTIPYEIKTIDKVAYGRMDQALIEFIRYFVNQTSILLDPVYTSRACQQLFVDIQSDFFPPNTSIAILHTGGLQAWYGMRPQFIQYSSEILWQKYIQKSLDR
ncbi:MAG: pyridoxal-phosphate dependent enzyme [Thiotrichaceae bacterium]|nr:pyridoxal-phosphate dependent enzyme [Thiotrichaceae bacterium]